MVTFGGRLGCWRQGTTSRGGGAGSVHAADGSAGSANTGSGGGGSGSTGSGGSGGSGKVVIAYQE